MDQQANTIHQPADSKPLFSLHWELKTGLYTGVLLLTTGLGVLVYKNIDTIGHQAILLFIALLSAGSYYYCIKNKYPFSTQKVESPNPAFDYILLLGSISIVTFLGYLQFQYNVFGNRFGLVTFIPMVVLFITAYYFDHLGILSMAITTLAAWAGIAATPQSLFTQNDFSDETLIWTGIALGVLLTLLSIASRKKNIKAHFDFSYINFGMHLLFACSIAGMFVYERIHYVLFILVMGIAWYMFREAKRRKSFYMLLMLTLYSYVAISAEAMHVLFDTFFDSVSAVYLAFLYYIASAVGLVLFLVLMNKNIKK